MTKEEAIEKARKLMALGSSDNEHEAAMAMQRAQELLSRFEIEMASLGEDTTAGEPYKEHGIPASKRNMVHWKRIAMGGIAKANGCDIYLHDNKIVLCGKHSDIEKCRMIYFACIGEIERLGRLLCVGRGKSYANSFKMGAAMAVLKSASDAAKAAKDAMRGTVTETALMVIDNRHVEARATMYRKHGWKENSGGSRYGGRAGGDGYTAGRSAGSNVYGRAGTGRVSGGSAGRIGA